MADKRIKGITIEIGGETTGLQKALADVNKKSRDIQSELKQVDRLLKFNPGNTELIAQKQQLLAEQVENTTETLNRLKTAQSQVEAQFRKGDIGAEQYRAFQREIVETQSKLDKFKKDLASVDDGTAFKNLSKDADEAKKSIGELGNELAGIAGGLVAGGGIAGAISQALDTSSLNTKIDITLDVPEESQKAVKDAIRDIQAYGIDGEAALEGIRRQWALNKDASDEANRAVIDGAATIAAAYSQIDFTELIQETNEIAKELNISNEEALGLTNSLLKIGFPPEQLDIIAEYGKQLTDAGFSAQEVQAIMAAGVETGTWNIDNLLDGLKEGRIKLAEFGQAVPDATKELLANTEISTQQLQTWGQAVAEGGEAGRTAMQEVAKALLSVEDETTRNALGVQFFGTMWEDQGTNITDTLLNMSNHLTTAKENQDALNESTSKLNADPAVKMQQAFSDMKTALEPLLLVIADVISALAGWISENPKFAAAIAAIVSIVGILAGAFMALSPLISGITAALPVLGTVFAALTGPIGIAIAAIAAAIAIGVALYKNWDEVKAWLSKTWDAIAKTASTVWNGIIDFFKKWGKDILIAITGPIGILVKAIIENWDKIKSTTSQVWESIKSTTSSVANGIKDSVSGIWNGIKSVTQSVWNGIKSAITNPIETAKNTLFGIIDKIKSAFANLKINIPKPKLPHIDVDWKSFGVGDAKIKVPTFDVNWYKTGGIFNGPSIIGVGEQPGVKEAAIPLSGEHMKPFAEEIARQMSKFTNGLSGQIIVPVILDGYEIARATYPYMDNLQGNNWAANNRYNGVR